ncbi:diguanylate cyclase [Iamia sp. SCSIO 61187]|uniref:GGDEF domain-containing protein n=1 Tax=Iamia sp. SCSIO 61187 TaxID=2722752 RepID=UPI001C62D9E4|nr:GGDEF domain-containing protein [Iamia sp. SCSIO 61187]QYG91081.1 diguanylate cyclase [Iamia sp. SCSIO 61187]
MDAPEDRPLEPPAREAVLAALLRQHPRALVSAIDAEGLFVETPPELVEPDRRVVAARSALELVEASDRRAIIAAWDRVKVDGASVASVRLANGVDARYHFVDVRHRHDVLVGVIVADGEADAIAAFAQRDPVVPKTGRTEKDEMAIIVHVDERVGLMLGYEPDALVGTRSLDLLHPDDQDRAVDAWVDMLTRPGGTSRLRARHRRADGTWLWMDLTNTNLLAEQGRVVTEMVDISDEMDAIEQVRQREHLLRRLTEALPSGVLHVDGDRHVVHANARLHELLGVPANDEVEPLLATLVAGDRAALRVRLDEVLETGVDADIEVRVQRPGEIVRRHCTVALRGLSDADGRPSGAVLAIADVTDEHRMRAELERRATVDELTGCLNRSAVIDALDRALADHARGSAGTAVAYFDLDDFKQVNDTLGHRAGDHVLAEVGERLRRASRHGDVVGRIGGDEFIAVLTDVAGAEEARTAARRLGATLAPGVQVADGPTLDMAWSVGVAWTDRPDADADRLIASADHRMYLNKRTA